MKKNVIALLLAVVMASGSIGTVPALAAEATTQEAVAVEEETVEDAEEAPTETEDAGAGEVSEDTTETESVDETDEVPELELAEEVDTTEEAEEAGTTEEEDISEEAEVSEETEESVEDKSVEESSEEAGTTEKADATEEADSTEEVGTAENAEEENTAVPADTSAEMTEEELAVIAEVGSTEVKAEEAALAGNVADSGTCGDNATWTLTGTGDDLTLTISGSGDMYDYASFNPFDPSAYSVGELPQWVSEVEIRKNINHIIVEEGITGIGSGAFSYIGSPEYGVKARIEEISLPLSLNKIGRYAFYYTGCDEVTIGSPNNPVIFECHNPKTGHLLKGYGLARSNFRKVNICLGDTSGGGFDSSTVESVVFLEGTDCIPVGCFELCEELQSVKIASSVISIGETAFESCSLASIVIPDDCSLESIGRSAFGNCSNLHTITLPEKLRFIDSAAFENCTSLERIDIPDSVTTINYSAFNGCTCLRTIKLPEGLESIPYGLLRGCESLESIVIPESVTEIAAAAFLNCKKLTKVEIPASVESLCVEASFKQNLISAFAGDTNLVEIIVDPNNMIYKSYDGCLYNLDLTELLYCPEGKNSITISPSTESVTRYAFVSGDEGAASSKIKKLYFGTCSPNLPENVFGYALLNATAYYNDFFGTWPSEKRQNYGGEITWVKRALLLSDCDITVSPTSYAYDGTEKKPAVSLKYLGKSLTENTDYTTSYEDNVNVGTGTITVTGKGHFTGTVSKSFKIKKATSQLSITGITSKTYNGKAQTQAVVVKDGTTTLVKGTDYTLAYKNNTNAGTASVTIKGKGNYTGSVTKTFTIKKAVNAITAKNFVKTYSASAQTFALGAKIKNGTPKYTSSTKSVTVSAKGVVTVKAKFIGKATITITAPEYINYSKTTKKITITVNPTKTALSSATSPAAGKMTVKWKKNAVGTGYQVQYSTSSKFATVKSAWLAKNTAVSKTLTGLTKGKKYYVRIRTFKTVGGVKYYSGWSIVKAVTIKK